MAMLKSSVVQGSLRVTDSTFTNSLTASDVINTEALKITSTDAISHLTFSRSNYNYLSMPAGSELVFVSGTTMGTEYGIRMKVTNNPKVTGGYIVPGVTNKMTLGDSSLKWAGVYATTFHGNLEGDVTGNADTATCVIHPDAGVNYIQGAKGSNAAVYAKKTYNANHWYPAVALETHGGGAWQIGNYNDETLEFVYATKDNRDANTNTTTQLYMQEGDTGRVATSGNVDTGDTNGQIKIAGTNVSVKGLGTAAYKAVGDFATATHTHNISLSQTGTSTIDLAASTVYTLTAGGKSIVFKTPADNNTDTKVAFSAATDNAEYPILLKNSTGSTTTTAGTKFANTSGKMTTINPSTGTITAPAFKGALTGDVTGNATSADEWATARTLTIGNKGQSVDGSKNISWTLAEIGAAALTGAIFTGNTGVEKASGAIYNYVKRTDTGLQCTLHINSSSTNHGIYSNGYYNDSEFTSDGKWLIYRNSEGNVVVNGTAANVTGTVAVSHGGTGLTTSTYKNAVVVGNASTVTNAFHTIRTGNGAFYATATDGAPSFGTLPVAQGGTGLTDSPSMLTNLGSTTAADILTASPRPGITGTLGVGHGGTGATSAANARTNLGTPTGNARIFYGTCATAAATTTKVVTCTAYDALQNGDIIYVTFSHTNSGAVDQLQLNVNGTGAKPIKYLGNATQANLPAVGYIVANIPYRFVYNETDTNWIMDLYYNTDNDYRTRQNVLADTDSSNRPLLLSNRVVGNANNNTAYVTYRNDKFYANVNTGTIYANGVAVLTGIYSATTAPSNPKAGQLWLKKKTTTTAST